jgi:hypothetical protein
VCLLVLDIRLEDVSNGKGAGLGLELLAPPWLKKYTGAFGMMLEGWSGLNRDE